MYRINHTLEEYGGTREGKFLSARGKLTVRLFARYVVNVAAFPTPVVVHHSLHARIANLGARVKRSPLHGPLTNFFLSFFLFENDLVNNEVAIKILYPHEWVYEV